ncbi:hypothetical protein [Microbacterium sp. GXF0217]
MSDDDLQITYGGSIAVNTETLRDVAFRLGPIEAHVGQASDAVYAAHRQITDAAGLSSGVSTVELWAVGDRLATMRTRILEVITGTLLMADAYELVELRTEYEALGLTDPAAAEALLPDILDLEASDERLGPMAEYLKQNWAQHRYEGLESQFDLATTVTGVNFGALTSIAAMLGSSAVFGTLPAKAKLDGWPDPVKVTPVVNAYAVAPPASLADGLRRFPDAEDAQVKVEKYTFEDGSAHYVAYIKGTQSGLYGAGEPWDMKSNTELYTGEISASYQATLDALHQAGAESGDVVDVYAHSQGAMVASYLAMGDEFDVQMLVTAGSPVQPTLRDDQLLIQLRHTDDVVNALAGGGSQGGTGSPDSLVLQREGDPMPSIKDLILEPHMLDTYIETAELADSSGDPRLEAYRERLRALAAATTIESTEYVADRTGWAE